MQPTVVPFRGGGDIVINTVGGNVDIGLMNFAEADLQIKSGDVRVLMVLADKRMAPLPNVTTAKELGIDANYSTVRGFVALKGTPEDRLKTLEEGLVTIDEGQDVRGIHREFRPVAGQRCRPRGVAEAAQRVP